MNQTLPSFKYNPNAFQNGDIQKKEITCAICKQESEYAYYSSKEGGDICPWCLAKLSPEKIDALTRAIQAETELMEEDEYFPGYYLSKLKKVKDIEKLVELERCTPRYSSWQEPEWPVHCEDFCAFVGYVQWEDVQHIQDAIFLEDIREFLHDYRMSQKEFEQYFSRQGSLCGYLFRCLICGGYRLHIDCD